MPDNANTPAPPADNTKPKKERVEDLPERTIIERDGQAVKGGGFTHKKI